MSEKRIFEVGYVETRQVAEYHRAIQIDISEYPELESKTDNEIIQYIKDNSSEMSPQDEFYDSLEDELMDQDVVRDKDWGMESSVWADVYREKEKNEDEDEEEEDDE